MLTFRVKTSFWILLVITLCSGLSYSETGYGISNIFMINNRGPVSGLQGIVLEVDSSGNTLGPLSDVTVTLDSEVAITNSEGQFSFTEMTPGTYTITAEKAGYYTSSPDVTLIDGQTVQQTIRMTAQSAEPTAYDILSPDGKHFIEGIPGSITLSTTIAWNGSPGFVYFDIAGTEYLASIQDLGGGLAQASLSFPLPEIIPQNCEFIIKVTNGEGQNAIITTGIFFYPFPEIADLWFGGEIDWLQTGHKFTSDTEISWQLWETEIPSGVYKSAADVGHTYGLSFDSMNGTFEGSIGGFGEYSQTLEFSKIENIGKGKISSTAGLKVEFLGSDPPAITSSWKYSFSGKAGVGAPAVLAVDAIFPPASPAVHYLLTVPLVKDALGALKMRLFFILGGSLSGEYENFQNGDCFLGSTSLAASVTGGLEGQAAADFLGGEIGIYAGGTGTPEFEICPELAFQGITLRAYIGIFANAYLFGFSEEIGAEIRLDPVSNQAQMISFVQLDSEKSTGGWQPISNDYLQWGPANQLKTIPLLKTLNLESEEQSDISQVETILENVTVTADPSLLAGSEETTILFSLHDPNKLWYEATDIAEVKQLDGMSWSLDQITDDQAADFSPTIAEVDSVTSLASWTNISGDISDANDPGQIVPHLEIVTSWLDQTTGIWSEPAVLTSNTVVDRDPVPVTFGLTQGILWIQNEGQSSPGDFNSGDRIMYSQWSGTTWQSPQVLWSGNNGVLEMTFAEDNTGGAQVIFVVDEDGDNDTKEDCELYSISTQSGLWQTSTRITNNDYEDALPVLITPNNIVTCVWDANDIVSYSSLDTWNPRPVYSDYTIANQAPSLDGATMPSGAAIAYTVQTPDGTDIMASFYDANLDVWSLPRQLTFDEHAETSLSLAYDGDHIAIAYLKTHTERTDMDIEIDGQIYHLENIPQPARTDLCLLKHTLEYDLALISDPNMVLPDNPEPNSIATITAFIENQGDLPIQDLQVAFYEGNPESGGVQIGQTQTISETVIAGGKAEISIPWNVSAMAIAREVYIVVDPNLAFNDRDRTNNILAHTVVLPDLEIERCWTTEISHDQIQLTARILNTGVIPTSDYEISWRLGDPNGPEIASHSLEPLTVDGAYETAYIWNTADYLYLGKQQPISLVVDTTNSINEYDDENNTYNFTVSNSLACPQSDLDENCRIDMIDLAGFSGYWMRNDCIEPDWCDGIDFDENGEVGLSDLVEVVYYWLYGI